MDIDTLLRSLACEDLPPEVQARAGMCLLDLTAIAVGGAQLPMARLIADHAHGQFGGPCPLLLDGRGASPAGVALAAGMTVDALDGHDGYNPAKGHAGCGVFAALLAYAQATGRMDGPAFLAALVAGYEAACRIAVVQHASVPDYHTSGSWVAVACAGLGARYLGLGGTALRHAMGIAEYHGPRSQMMRVIDHPTMLKDGSGWGAMAGVSAAYLAQAGFTGAPALTVEAAAGAFDDLGQRWLILEQYFKPYPVCRWAHAPVEAGLALRRAHGLSPAQIRAVQVETFHESVRLAKAEPATTEEAQYSTSYPLAVALVRGRITPQDVDGPALLDPEIRRLAQATTLLEHEKANAAFPGTRLARVTLTLADGRHLRSDWHRPRWDGDSPPSEAEIRGKYREIAEPALGRARAGALEATVRNLPRDGLAPYLALMSQPISRRTKPASPE
ncbi:MmgE/PrpD family protein [Pseudoruegeria aquimaris]|uniref:MmgE/PrpD family protein n=1 Tax=Pseudoruegeria aquimaris TaxID=393663 RepID=A0A1Y5RWW6_9RHOB|nr:MmgE/PrpD family protein [Pseudoruegeria aquimaris]SLN27344.1 MmgE/PrpD family protein [Pseudoruegeria aquimaris]